MNNGDRSAYGHMREATPLERQQHGLTGPAGEAPMVWVPGLTKREDFAKAAMQGLLASGAAITYMNTLSDEQIKNMDWCVESHISLMSVSLANGLLAALEETK